VLKSRAAELKASSFTVVPEHKELQNIKLGTLTGHVGVAMLMSIVSQVLLDHISDQTHLSPSL
jgi:hypothetical protein